MQGGDCCMDKNVEQLQENKQTDNSLIHDFSKAPKYYFTSKVFGVFAVVLVLGLISGYILVGVRGGSTSLNSLTKVTSSNSNSGSVVKGTIEGSTDTKTFSDTAEGTLKSGGIDGEGAYHLERPGGDSQNVYLTSSIVDLSKFVNSKVKIWGQTQKAQTAGWLMDVGRIQAL